MSCYALCLGTGHHSAILVCPLAFTLSRAFLLSSRKSWLLHLLHNEMIAFLWWWSIALSLPLITLYNVMAWTTGKTHPCCSSSDSMNWAAHVSCAKKPKVQFWQVKSSVSSDLHPSHTHHPVPKGPGLDILVPTRGQHSSPTRRAFSSLPVLEGWSRVSFLQVAWPNIRPNICLFHIYLEPLLLLGSEHFVSSFEVGPSLR